MTAGASLSLRGEGPYQLPQKRSLALVSILRSLAAVGIANVLHSRDFRSPAIFEFFNTIDPQETFRSGIHGHQALPAGAAMSAMSPGWALSGHSPIVVAACVRPQRSSRAIRLEVSQRLPPIFSTSA